MKRTRLARKTALKRSGKFDSLLKRVRYRQEKELDRLCRIVVVELRDRNTCQRCGASGETHKIDWSHVVTRSAKSIRWVEWNSKALCAGCHSWWSSHPTESGAWWREKWPDRARMLAIWRQQSKHRVDREMTRLYLEQKVGGLS